MKLTRRLFSFLLVLVLLVSAIPITARAAGPVMYGIGFTTGSDLRLRESPSTSSKILDVAPKGEVVVVIGKSGDWYHVIYNLQEGYMHKNYVSVQTSQNVELGYGKINGTEVNLRTGPGTNYRAVTQGNKGDRVYIIGLNSGWYKVIYGQNVCYIRSDYVDLTEIPYENDASDKTPLFFKNGQSTGVTPSADALNSTTGSDNAFNEKEDEKDTSSDKTTTGETSSTPTTTVESGLVQGIAFVNASGLYLRSQPNTSSSALACAPRNEVVVVLGKSGDWYKVNYNLKEGYMHGDYLTVQTTGSAELGYGKITGSSVNLRSGASTSGSVVAVASQGSTAYIIGVENGWYKVIYGQNICYIRSDYLALTEYPYENQASAKSPLFFRGGKSTGTEPSASALNGSTGNSGSTGTTTPTVSGAQILATAQKYLGIPYVWGGASPSGFDCSGLVYYVLKTLGYSPARTCSGQYAMGTYVSKENLQPGDIVFFANTYGSGISHVGIYAGNGQFIHSPNSRSVVSYANLTSGYWAEHYYGARRMG